MARSSPTIFRSTSVCCNVRRPQPKPSDGIACRYCGHSLNRRTALPVGTAALLLGISPLQRYTIASRTARYVRRGIPHGAVRAARYPARRGIPPGMVCRTARCRSMQHTGPSNAWRTSASIRSIVSRNDSPLRNGPHSEHAITR